MAFDWQSLIGGSITDGVAKIIQLFKVDPTVALTKQVELEEIRLKMQSDVAASIAQQLHDQTEINKTEAATGKLFIAGWRPFVGWVCGIGLAMEFVIGPFVTWIAALAGHPVAWPHLAIGQLLGLLGGMLGFGGFRTYEKATGVDTKDIG